MKSLLIVVCLFFPQAIYGSQSLKSYQTFESIPQSIYRSVHTGVDYFRRIQLSKSIIFRGLPVAKGYASFYRTDSRGKPLPGGFTLTEATLSQPFQVGEITLPKGSKLSLKQRPFDIKQLSGSADIDDKISYKNLLIEGESTLTFLNSKIVEIRNQSLTLDNDLEEGVIEITLRKDLVISGKKWEKGLSIILDKELIPKEAHMTLENDFATYNDLPYRSIAFYQSGKISRLQLAAAMAIAGVSFPNHAMLSFRKDGSLRWALYGMKVKQKNDIIRKVFIDCFNNKNRRSKRYDATFLSRSAKGVFWTDAERICKNS